MFSKDNFRFWLVWLQISFPLCFSPFETSFGPHVASSLLDGALTCFDLRRRRWTVFADGDSWTCSRCLRAWRWRISDIDFQLRGTRRDFWGCSESFDDYVTHCTWWANHRLHNEEHYSELVLQLCAGWWTSAQSSASLRWSFSPQSC